MSLSTFTLNQPKKDSDILHRIANDDKTAVEQCLNVYGGLIWSIAKQYCYSREDAEDAVQDIFIDIWRNAGRFDAEKSPEISFITLIARRRLIDWVRKSKHRPQLCYFAETSDNQSNEDHRKLQLHIELTEALQVLKRLKPQQKEIVQMAIFSGMSHREISEMTGLPFGTVKSLIRRGLQKVREYIEDETNKLKLLKSNEAESA